MLELDPDHVNAAYARGACENKRGNFAKAIEGMQAAVETDTKAKQEANRMRKKLDADVVELGIALEHANAANSETNRNIKLIQENIRELFVLK